MNEEGDHDNIVIVGSNKICSCHIVTLTVVHILLKVLLLLLCVLRQGEWCFSHLYESHKDSTLHQKL